MEAEEDRYEHIELIVKTRFDGEAWFDVLHDYITKDCQGSGGDCVTEDEDSDCDDHEHTELFPCTCGMEHMSGMGGTLQQCFDYSASVSKDLKYIDLAHAIVSLTNYSYNSLGTHEEQIAAERVIKAINWAHREIEFEERWNDPIGD